MLSTLTFKEGWRELKLVHEAEKGVSRISVSLPSDLLEEFDDFVRSLKLDRSKAVQMAIRNFLTEYKVMEASGPCAGVISIIYNHEVKGLEEKITDIQHEYGDVIVATLHAHLTKNDCMEVITVRGDAEKIRDLSERLLANRGVKQLKVTISHIGP